MVSNAIGSSIVSETIRIEKSKEEAEQRSKFYNESLTSDSTDKVYKWDIVWFNVIVFGYMYLGAFYGMYLFFFVVSWKTVLWCVYLTVSGTLGATAGAHRLWTHKTYKAKLPLQILLMLFQATCFQNHIYEWTRDHRMHHKYTDTDADPHNATRGFFFSHVGWLMVRKHKDVIEKGKTIWMKDLEEDPVVMFQKKYFAVLMPMLCFILPAVVPWYFWNEPISDAWYAASVFRYVLNVNGTWLVNSAAHLYGMRPYDKNIMPRENTFVGYLAMGEGWHNYHHTFPWDYKAGEFKGYLANLTTGFIDIMARIGWAYDLKSVPIETVRRRMFKTGDGSKTGQVPSDTKIVYESHVWGWDDNDMTREDMLGTDRYFVKDN